MNNYFSKMSWNTQMDVYYQDHSMPYNSIGSFVDFFGGLTYDHVNYIFADVPYVQENAHPAMNSNLYKFAASEPGNLSYYEYGHGCVVNNHISGTNQHEGHLESPSVLAGNQATISHVHQAEISNTGSHASPLECPRNPQAARDLEVVWQDNIDPDNMTYEELLELGETVGTRSRGLSQDQIALLPTSKFKWTFFFRKKFSGERCVICQMEYKRGEKRIILPCKHLYHTVCGSRWLRINKACPICYKDVIADVPKH
ncbi:E3 ubiquitin-protein ligase BIG BROTHER-like isoform X2 [Primulina eburnea]|uniref:E3 ubiquitin-protein ligase BIG BROTHER-like isoform X2 n=1 Tax=Primulina eburnea TaxID=1245227 RepID=UPI003C6BE268